MTFIEIRAKTKVEKEESMTSGLSEECSPDFEAKHSAYN